MGRINILDTKTANAIKAGEVIERPVSVIKELFDNAVDAGATNIKVEFTNGGISMIRVTDNGIGMDREDARKAFLIHATSKLTKIEDLYDLSTQGFRGEALASICACADVTLITKQADSPIGTKIVYRDGELVEETDCSADNGTVVEVTGLFKNIPARYKFLKKDSTEGMYIANSIEKLAIINPEVSVKLIKDGKQLLLTPGNGEMYDAIYAIYGKEVCKSLVPVEYSYEEYKLKGYTGKTDYVRGNRGMQCVFVNDRNVRNTTVTAAIDEAYRNAVMKNKFPICFLRIYCNPGSVDVNVHPQKAEVKFSNESDVFRLCYHGIQNAVFEANAAKEVFAGINKTEETVVKESVPEVQTSKKFTTYASNPKPASTADTKQAIDLLRILSEFKPDITEIKGEEPSENIPVPETISEPEVIPETPARTIPEDIMEMYNAEFVGILFVTYIVLQSEKNVFFVDQHAAHERVMYEKFMDKKAPGKQNFEVQNLLIPAIIRLSAADYTFVSDNVSRFMDNGYEIELLDDREIALRSVPMISSRRSPEKMFEEVILDLKKENPAKGDIWYSLIQVTACRAAIKAGDRIEESEARELIKELTTLDDPYHCAHGRPTFFKISRTDFEKNFKRIV